MDQGGSHHGGFMGFRINNSIAALLARNNLNSHEKGLTRSIERLSSGLRLNRSADDPTGMSISQKLSAQISGLNSAIIGSQQGISILQTADGALSESSSILARMRELAVQSQSASLTSDDRLELQAEVDELISAIDNVASTTEFNKRNLLNGSASARVSTSDASIKAYQTGIVKSGRYSVELRLTNIGSSEIQRSAIQTLRSNDDLATSSTTMGELESMFDSSDNEILANPLTLSIRANGKNSDIVVSKDLSLQQFAQRIEDSLNAPKSQGGLELSGSTFAFDSSTSQFVYEAGKAGTLGELTLAADEDFISGLGFSISSESNDTAHQVTATEQGVYSGSSYSTSTNTERAIGVIPGLDLKFEITQEARLDGTVAGQKSIRIHSSNSDVVFTFHDTNAEDNNQIDSSITAGTRITLTAGRSYSTSSIATIINKAITVSNDSDHALTAGHGSSSSFQNPGVSASFSGYNLVLTSTATGTSARISIAANDSARSILGLSSGAFSGTSGTAAILTGTTNTSSGVTFAGTSVVRIRVGDGDYNINQQSTSTDITFNQGATITSASLIDNFNNYFSVNNVKVSASVNANGNLVLTSTETGTDSKVSIFAVGGASISAIGLNSGDVNSGSGGNAAVITGSTSESVQTVGFNLTGSLRFSITDKNNTTTETIHFGAPGIDAAAGESFTISKSEIISIMDASSILSTDASYRFDQGNRLDFFSRSSGQSARIILNTSNSTQAIRGLTTFGIDFNSAAQGKGKTNFDIQVSDRRLSTTVGSNGQILQFDINNVSAEALGISGLDILSTRSATRSMGLLDDAIRRVTGERSRIGSYENRLINSMDVMTNTAINLEAARSLIRDTDVAKETVEFTKSQLLLQSATAQLIQANSISGNVIALLE